jgi:hypothetical protein
MLSLLRLPAYYKGLCSKEEKMEPRTKGCPEIFALLPFICGSNLCSNAAPAPTKIPLDSPTPEV